MHNKLLFVDVKAQKSIGTADINDPRGVAFDRTGKLLVLSGKSLLRFKARLAAAAAQAGHLRVGRPERSKIRCQVIEVPTATSISPTAARATK